MRETRVQSLSPEDPLEKEMATHSSTLAWRIPWMRSLVATVHGGRKESDTTEQLHFPTFPPSLSSFFPSFLLSVLLSSLFLPFLFRTYSNLLISNVKKFGKITTIVTSQEYFKLSNEWLWNISLLAVEPGFPCLNFLWPRTQSWGWEQAKGLFKNCSKIDLQCCVNFCYTTKWLNCSYTYIPSLMALSPPPASHPSESSQSTELSSLCYIQQLPTS